MTRGRGRKSLYIVGIVAWLAHSSDAPAQTPAPLPTQPPPAAQGPADAKKSCLTQHEAAQTFRRTGKLLEARDAILVCSREDCPAAVRADCGDWLDGVTKNIPSLVFRVKLDDKDVSDVRVSVDGKLVTSHLDGTPFELNPGAHSLRFEYATMAPIEQELIVLEGEKNRVVAASFAKAVVASKEPVKSPESLPPLETTYRPTPAMTYVLGGVALAGFGSFAAFAISGQAKKKDLESSCRPTCSDNELQPVRTQFLIADVSLAVAITSTLAAGIVYFTRPDRPRPDSMKQGKTGHPASAMAFGFAPTATGAQFAMHGEF
jgi:hypothetical protein